VGTKVHPALILGGVFIAAVIYATVRDHREGAEQARANAEIRAKREARAAAIKAQKAAENSPERIAERAHQAQIDALEKADRDDAASKACRASAQCWFDKHRADAEVGCVKAVERLAQYQFEWTDSMFGKRRFDRVGWVDQDAGTILLAGNAIKMQNGFGAWRNMSYRCAFDSGTGNAVASAE
jgi:hypothetical protein